MARKILLLITDLHLGGTPTVVRELALGLHRPPTTIVEVACLDDWGPVAQQLHDGGIGVTALRARSRADVRIVWRLLKLIRARQFDTVVSFLIHANAIAASAAPLCPGVRFFQSIQTTQPKPRWHWRLQGVVARSAEKIIVPSASVAQRAARWSDIDPGRFAVIPNGVHASAFARPGGVIDRPLATPPRLLFLGRLDPVKRIDDLLRAVAQLNCCVQLDIVGSGSELRSLTALAKALHIESSVNFRGATDRPAEALHAADLLILPSEAEGFGLVLIEAMAAGVPVLATDVSGIRDVVRHGENGFLVPVGSPHALATAITHLLNDPALRRNMVHTGLSSVAHDYGWGPVTSQYRKLLSL